MNTSKPVAQSLTTKLTEHGITLNRVNDLSTTNDLSTPWFVKLLAMGSGWLTAIFMTGVFALLFDDILESPILLSLCGLAAIALARFSFSGQPSDFREHLALAISLVGQLLITFAVFEFTDSYHELAAPTWLILLLLHACLLLVMPNKLHRHTSAIAASTCLGLLFSSLGWFQIYSSTALAIIALLTLNEFKPWFKPKILIPLAYGFALQFLLPVVYNPMLNEAINKHTDQPLWLLNLSMTLVLLVVALILAQRYKVNKQILLAVSAAAIVIGVTSVELSGITAGCVILLLGRAHSNRNLLGLGVLSLLTQTSFYYYNLDASLLVKAMGLGGLGLSLLVMRWLMLLAFNSTQPHTEGSYE